MKRLVPVYKNPLVSVPPLLLMSLVGCSSGDNSSSGEPDLGPASPDATSVSSTIPDAEALGVPVTANVEASFTAALDAASVTENRFTLYLGDERVPATVSVDGTTAILDPTDVLQRASRYRVSINSDVIDSNGDALEAYEWYFDTADFPVVGNTIPASDAKGIAVDANVSALFDKPLLMNSVDSDSFTLHLDDELVAAEANYNGINAILDPTDDLFPSTRYRATLNQNVVDLDGNALQTHEWSFYTDGNGWGRAEEVDANSDGSTADVQIGTDAEGNAIAVWEQDHSIFANRYDIDTGWGNAVSIDSSGSFASNPQVSVDADGNALVVWAQGGDIVYNRYTAGGSWGVADAIAPSVDRAQDPQISMDAAGNAVAVWAEEVVSGGDVSTVIYSVFYTAQQDVWVDQTFIDSYLGSISSATPQVSLSSDGSKAAAVWVAPESGSSGQDEIFSAVLGESGWVVSGSIDRPDSSDDSRSPQIGVDDSGNAIAIWVKGIGLFTNQYDGVAWGSANPRIGGQNSESSPQISVEANGDAFVLTNLADRIFATRYVADGTEAGWEFFQTIAFSSTGPHAPQIGVDANGNAIAVWEQGDEVFTNRYSDDSWGNAELIAGEVSTDTIGAPQVSVTADGNAFAVWPSRFGNIGGLVEDGVFSSRFDIEVITP